ncbi:MAG TPA: cytochrome c3 family protein [Candidatus Brocadiaceae bacterium]
MFDEVKRLNKKDTIKLGAFAVLAIGIVLAVTFITVIRPKQAQFCANCHNNIPNNISFDNTCKKSLSKDIACCECHRHENERLDKGIKGLAADLTKGLAVMSVEIKNEQCTSEACHPLSKLSANTVQYKNITPFQHKTHLATIGSQVTSPYFPPSEDGTEEGMGSFQGKGVSASDFNKDMFAGNIKLRCTSCHTNLGGKKHFELDTKTCDICHFTATAKPFNTHDKKPISDCTICHSHVEKVKKIYEKTFKHDVYEGNKRVSCTDCHFKIVQGNGKVDKERCYQCHQKGINTFRSAADNHIIHINKHKTACSSCHASVTHGWIKANNDVSGEDSNARPADTDYNVQNLIMMGMGGVGVKGEPDPMYLATLNCSACHKDKLFANVKFQVCNDCHGRGFDKILFEQKRYVSFNLQLLKTLLIKAKSYQNVNTDRIIRESEMNYNLIKKDGSFGVHNVKYVKDLLNYNIVQLKQVISQNTNIVFFNQQNERLN